MLVDPDTESRIKGLFQAAGNAIAIYLTGRGIGQAGHEATLSALGFRHLTPLEQGYLAGKVAQQIGPELAKDMTPGEITLWIQSHQVQLDDADLAQLKGLRKETERWIEGRTADLQKRFNQALTTADREWTAETAKSTPGDAAGRAEARNLILASLALVTATEVQNLATQAHSLAMNELHGYFQQGQKAEMDADALVYKIPRDDACTHCMRLHLNADGSPKIYRLADVAGNSNIGAKPPEWAFVLGLTHPNCRCTLYEVGDETPGPSKVRAAARKTVLGKAVPGRNENTLEILRKAVEEGSELPPHWGALLDVLREAHAG